MLLVGTALASIVGVQPAGASATSVAVSEVALPGFTRPGPLTTGPDDHIWFASVGKIGRLNDDGSATEFAAPASVTLSGIATGPDGNLWFTATETNQIGRLTPAGQFTMFPIPTGSALPSGIASDGVGNVWFAEQAADRIGEISTGGTFHEYVLPMASSSPTDIALGPDGNMWFTEPGRFSLGRITPGGSISEFPLPSGDRPGGIAAGPDGTVWFTDSLSGHVGHILTSAPYTITQYLPESNGRPAGIVAGSDGRMWVRLGRTRNIGAITTDGTTTFYGRGLQGASIAPGTDGNLHLTEPSTRRTPWAGRVDQVTTDGVITRVRLPGGGRFPKGITTGPDGNLWFTEEAPLNHGVARLTPRGRLTEFAVPPSATSGGTGDITSGPDGNVWFTRPGGTVDRVTLDGIVTEFTVPRTGSDPEGIAEGPDGNLWVTDRGTDPRIWRVTPTGHFSGYRLPNSSSALGITVGPDGALWFADWGVASIGRITTDGTITYYPLPSGRPFDITAGPDGNLWFTEDEAGRLGIGRIGPGGGTITQFPLWKDVLTIGITAGPDGNIWFTAFPHWICRITVQGVARRFATPTPGSQPPSITPGLNGGLWFTEQFNDRVGRVAGP